MDLTGPKASPSLVDQQPTMAMEHFRDRDKLAAEQFAPYRADFLIRLAKAKLQIRGGALETWPTATDVKPTELL